MKVPDPRHQEHDQCLRWAVAALTETSLEHVPHFVGIAGSNWWSMLQAWGQGRGYDVSRYWNVGVDVPLPDWEYLGIIAPRGRCHAVVMQGNDVLYDPSRYPRKRYRKSGMGVIQFVPVSAG